MEFIRIVEYHPNLNSTMITIYNGTLMEAKKDVKRSFFELFNGSVSVVEDSDYIMFDTGAEVNFAPFKYPELDQNTIVYLGEGKIKELFLVKDFFNHWKEHEMNTKIEREFNELEEIQSQDILNSILDKLDIF